MITEKLYYSEPYRKSLPAKIIDVKTAKKGLLLATDQTIFYPGGGGQSPDRGKIDRFDVIDLKQENGAIYHLIEGDAGLTKGKQVEMKIDWPARYYNMQQHSGQHLVSRVFFRRGRNTHSVHLGSSYTLIEVDGPLLTDDELQAVEDDANELIRSALPIRAHWVDRDNAEQFPLRRPPVDRERLRVIEIDNIEYVACGGTHVKNTAEIGYAKIIGQEKIRSHARAKILFGRQADAFIQTTAKVQYDLIRHLQVEPEQFAERIGSLKESLQSIKEEKDFYNKYYIEHRAGEIADEHESKSPVPAIVFGHQGHKTDDALAIAKELAENHEQIAFVLTGNRFYLCAPDAGPFDTNAFLKENREALQLKGGGPRGLAQGIIDNPDIQKIETALIEHLKKSGF